MQIPQPEEPPSLLMVFRQLVGLALCITIVTAQVPAFHIETVYAQPDTPTLTDTQIASLVSIALGDVNQKATLVTIEIGKSNATVEAERIEAERLAVEKEKQRLLSIKAAQEAQEAARKAKTVKATPAPVQREIAAVAQVSHGDLLAAAGIAESEWGAAEWLIGKESGWNVSARNKSSGACGIPQALPCSKMSSAGSDYLTNPVTQLRWMDGYVKARYGSWGAAVSFHKSHNWY